MPNKSLFQLALNSRIHHHFGPVIIIRLHKSMLEGGFLCMLIVITCGFLNQNEFLNQRALLIRATESESIRPRPRCSDSEVPGVGLGPEMLPQTVEWFWVGSLVAPQTRCLSSPWQTMLLSMPRGPGSRKGKGNFGGFLPDAKVGPGSLGEQLGGGAS